MPSAISGRICFLKTWRKDSEKRWGASDPRDSKHHDNRKQNVCDFDDPLGVNNATTTQKAAVPYIFCYKCVIYWL